MPSPTSPVLYCRLLSRPLSTVTIIALLIFHNQLTLCTNHLDDTLLQLQLLHTLLANCCSLCSRCCRCFRRAPDNQLTAATVPLVNLPHLTTPTSSTSSTAVPPVPQAQVQRSSRRSRSLLLIDSRPHRLQLTCNIPNCQQHRQSTAPTPLA